MKKIYLLLILIFYFTISYSQSTEDYELINQVLPNLVGSMHIKDLKIYEKTAKFENQERFFNEEFFKDYLYSTLGVDSTEVKKLIQLLDFKYLANQIKEANFWNLDMINVKLTKYEANPKRIMDLVTRFSIATPVYTYDKKFAFIYYVENCGGPDCGSATVKIYKQNKGKWIYYAQIPIWIS